MTELLHLFTNVSQQRIAQPLSNNHHEVDWTRPPINIAIAAPDQSEWVPISETPMFNTCSPMAETASVNAFITCFEVTVVVTDLD